VLKQKHRLTFSVPFICLIFAISIISFAFAASATSSRVITVNPGGSIQEAINNADEGDTIIVKSGTYHEWPIVVNKTLTIIGESLENTIIEGNGEADVLFQVVASNVAIENFTLQKTDVSFSVQGTAIRISKAINVKVSDVYTKDTFCGIELLSSNLTKVAGCKISSSMAYGVNIHDKSVNNTFVANTIANNSIGVSIADSASQYNTFYHNNFINNTSQASVMSLNYFDNGYPSGGNFWSDHIKTDLKHGVYQNESGSDGIVDENYLGDRYPLANPLTSLEVCVNGEQFEVEVSTNSSLNSYAFNFEEKCLTLFSGGVDGTVGSCRVSIPKRLLSCDSPSQWNITLSNSEQLTYLASEDGERAYLYFTYNQSYSIEVEIRGTSVVPEFPCFSMLLCLLGIIFILIILFPARFLSKDLLKASARIRIAN